MKISHLLFGVASLITLNACHNDQDEIIAEVDGTWVSDCITNTSPKTVTIKGPYQKATYHFSLGEFSLTSMIYKDEACTHAITPENTVKYIGRYTVGDNVTELDGAPATRLDLRFDSGTPVSNQFTAFSRELVYRLEGSTLYFGPYFAGGLSDINYDAPYHLKN